MQARGHASAPKEEPEGGQFPPTKTIGHRLAKSIRPKSVRKRPLKLTSKQNALPHTDNVEIRGKQQISNTP
eukprot:4454528-Amphidinium_carterae.1